MEATDTTQFRLALEQFLAAAQNLSETWETTDTPPDIFGPTYPSYLPSFDEFVSDLTQMERGGL